MAPFTRLARRRYSFVSLLCYELLSEIFLRAVSGEEDVKNGQKQLINLMLVCRQWRNVALDTPGVWCQIAFDLVGNTIEEKVVIQQCMLWFSRAKTLPLSIDIFFRATVLSESSDMLGEFLFPKFLIWDYLASINRLRRIRLCSPTISYISGWYTRSKNNQQHLVIDASPESQNGVYRFVNENDVRDTHRMCRANIERSKISPSKPNSLTTVSLRARMSSSFVLRLLEESPLLETCDIDMEQSYLRSWEHGLMEWTKLRGGVSVVLPKLRTLRVSNFVEGQDELARFLRATNLRELRISNCRSDIDLFLGTSVVGSKSTLEHLDLHLLSIDDNKLLDVIRHHANFNALTLHGLERVNGSFLDDLQLYENRSLLSKLRTLDIECKWDAFDNLALVRFIKRRGTSWKRSPSTEEEKTLEWASFRDPRTPKLYVRYDASEPKTQLMRTVMVTKVEE